MTRINAANCSLIAIMAISLVDLIVVLYSQLTLDRFLLALVIEKNVGSHGVWLSFSIQYTPR